MSIDVRFTINRGDFVLDVNFSCPSKGVSAILGHSGCGKTTLLRAIAGLEQSNNGYLNVAGKIWQDKDTFVPTHKRHLGYVFQEANLFPHISVRKNLEYGLKRTPVKKRQVTFDKAVEMLGVTALLKRYPGALSGGERQRVAIARALLTSPRLLLMDEPMAGLDIESKADIFPFLERLHEDLSIPILYVSHIPEEVVRLADYLMLMGAGKVKASGPINEMLTRTDIPLAHSRDASSIVEAEVIRHDKKYGLTYLKFTGGIFTVGQKKLPEGRKVRLRVLARDVSITLLKQSDTSILNIFPAKIEELASENSSQTTVRLNIGGSIILSRITKKSAEALQLSTGCNIYAQIKSIAITR